MTLIRDKHDTDEAHKVTAVVHPRGKKQERVFVESEVKAMLLEVSVAMCWDFPPQEMRIVLLKHGIDLKPESGRKRTL